MKKQKGISLVETVIVLALIGIIGGGIVTKGSELIKQAETGEFKFQKEMNKRLCAINKIEGSLNG